jgi:alpha-L-fucosidase
MPRPLVRKLGTVECDLVEATPLVFRDRLYRFEYVRQQYQHNPTGDSYLRLVDHETGEATPAFGHGWHLGSAFSAGDRIWVYAVDIWDGDTIRVWWSDDLERWETQVALRLPGWGLFNTSVCQGPEGFVMAYESDDRTYVPFTVKFARSTDLEHWTKLPEATFATNRYTACPCLRYANGYYYVLYLERRTPRHFFQTYITRSPDLVHWELSAANPVLTPDEIDDSINASDPELVEFKGQTYVYYCVGDQLTWANVKRALYPGPLPQFLESWYTTPGIPDWGAVAYSPSPRPRHAR